MKTKQADILTISLFCGFLGLMLLLFLLLPRQDFSEREKRYLADGPELTMETLLSGEFGENAETWLADHVPGRDMFVGLAAYYDLFTGRQVTKDVLVADGDRLVEAPKSWNADAVQKNMKAINGFATAIGQPVDLMIVPSAGYVLEDTIQGLKDDYRDDEMIGVIYGAAGEQICSVDVLPEFRQAEDPAALYYRTDHHWTSLGAYTAYETYMQEKGRDYPKQEEFLVEWRGGFCGSTHSRSGLWLIGSENVELWKTKNTFYVTNGESDTVHEGLFYEERLEELDQYTVYLDGNHSVVRIENPAAAGKGSLLVIRDSYANCLGTFLAHSYERVVLVDLRYYKNPVSELVTQEGFDDVLVCYSIGNFLTDPNMVFLR